MAVSQHVTGRRRLVPFPHFIELTKYYNYLIQLNFKTEVLNLNAIQRRETVYTTKRKVIEWIKLP